LDPHLLEGGRSIATMQNWRTICAP